MEAELERHPGFLVLRVKGNMRLWGHPELEARLLQTFRAGLDDSPAQLVLNMGGLTNLDTLGIAALVRVLIECSKRKMDLKVVLPPGMAGEALRCVRVFEPWPSYQDEQAAIQAAAAWPARSGLINPQGKPQ